MVTSPSGLAIALTADAPEELLERNIEAKREEIERALKAGGEYKLEDDQGRVFLINPVPARK